MEREGTLYHIPPGQVCEVEEEQEDVWRVKLLSGGNSGSSVCVHRSQIEEYSGGFDYGLNNGGLLLLL